MYIPRKCNIYKKLDIIRYDILAFLKGKYYSDEGDCGPETEL